MTFDHPGAGLPTLAARLGEADFTTDGDDGTIVTATVAGIDGDMATVLVGDELEPWDFPLSTLPDAVPVGARLEIRMAGRWPVESWVEGDAGAEEVNRRLDRLDRLERLTGHAVG